MRIQIGRLLVLAGVLLLSLYDFYFPRIGLPIVPIGGATALLVAAVIWPSATSATEHGLSASKLLLGLAIVSFFWFSATFGGLTQGTVEAKGPLGLTLGALVLIFVLFRGSTFFAWAYRGLRVALAAHVAAWCIQFSIFHLEGHFVDFIEPLTGMMSRHDAIVPGSAASSVEFVTRFSGLFQEPAVYCTFAFMAVGARLIHARFRLAALDVIALATMLLSSSISGFGYLLAVALVLVVHSRQRAAALAVVALLVGVVATAYVVDPDAMDYVAARVTHLQRDTSFLERYGTFSGAGAGHSAMTVFFGRGAGTYEAATSDALRVRHGSGFGFLYNYFGVVGTALVFSLLATLLWRRASSRAALVLVGATLFGAPLFSNMLWWLWLGLLSHPAVGREVRSIRGSRHTDVSHRSVGERSLLGGARAAVGGPQAPGPSQVSPADTDHRFPGFGPRTERAGFVQVVPGFGALRRRR